ncbi:nudC domain-containing protein 1-like [Polymixia lowei]
MGDPFIILHSISYVQAGAHTIDVLLLRIQKDSEETKGSGYSVSLEWITVDNAVGQGQEKKYEVRKRRLLTGKSVPHYAAVEPQGKGLMVASEKPFVFTHVDGLPVEQPAAEPMEVETTDPIYFWQQTAEDITVSVRMPEGITKDQVLFRCLIGGVQMVKDYSGTVNITFWDRRGEYVVSEEQAALIHQRLTHLTAEDLNANPDSDKPPCNSQELEDCDGFPEDSSTLSTLTYNLMPAHVMSFYFYPGLLAVKRAGLGLALLETTRPKSPTETQRR